MTEPEPKARERDLATNRRARHEYRILETVEAGIELLGSEVKSARGGQASLAESFADFDRGQAVLRDLHLQPYRFSHTATPDPRRPRRLLLHKREILRLQGLAATQGIAVVPLRLYVKRGRIKVELALCRGKQHADRRETLRRKTFEREAEREIAARRRA